jgi:hypothetical protein
MHAAFASMHADLIAAMGEPATYAPAAGGAVVSLNAVLDRNTAELGEYGQTVAYRPSISVLCADVAKPQQGDIITFLDPVTGVVSSTWQVVRQASADDMVAVLWVAPA